MHPLDGFKGNCFPVGKLLRPDLACLSSTLVAVPFVEFNPSLGIGPNLLAVIGVRLELLPFVILPR